MEYFLCVHFKVKLIQTLNQCKIACNHFLRCNVDKSVIFSKPFRPIWPCQSDFFASSHNRRRGFQKYNTFVERTKEQTRRARDKSRSICKIFHWALFSYARANMTERGTKLCLSALRLRALQSKWTAVLVGEQVADRICPPVLAEQWRTLPIEKKPYDT